MSFEHVLVYVLNKCVTLQHIYYIYSIIVWLYVCETIYTLYEYV